MTTSRLDAESSRRVRHALRHGPPGNGSSSSNPFRENTDFLVGQFSLRRHLKTFRLIPDSINEQAFLGLSWNDRRSLIPAFQDRGR